MPKTPLRRPAFPAWKAGAVLAAIGALILVLALSLKPGVFTGMGDVVTAKNAIGGPFTLTDTKGRRWSEKELAGKPYAIFFGFTHCPEVCPTTLSEMTGWIGKLGAGAERMRFVFVTVDPERDTQADLAAYLSSFDPHIVGLTGTRAEVDGIVKAYRVYARRVDTKDGDYTMDHTAAVYLMDGSGNFQTVIGYDEPEEKTLVKLKQLIDAG